MQLSNLLKPLTQLLQQVQASKVGVLPYKGLLGTCGQPGYVSRDFCLEQGIDLSIFVLNWVKCLKQGIKNRNSVLNREGKSAIFD